MKKYAYIFAIVPMFLFLNVATSLAGNATDSSIGQADDCTDISIDFKDAANLTSQERAELMNQVFMASLNKYERCQTSAASSHSGENSRSMSANNVTNGEHPNTGQDEPNTSTASSQMSGTQTPVEDDALATTQTEVDQSSVSTDAHKRNKGARALANGKIPDDIPAADNDSILEEQIRQAASNETDPVIQAKLWNEYRKYKGLPVVRKP